MKALIKFAVVALAVFLLAAWGIGSYLGVDDLSSCDETPSSKEGCGPADAIVAVSGGDTEARTSEAIKLYKNGWGSRLIFSGAAADKSGPSNAEVMERQAIAAGVNPASIIIETTSETTSQNASETTDIFKMYNIKSAIIVTSAYHERRAVLEFNRRALGVAVRAHPVASDKQWSSLWWLTPTGWMLAIPEYIRSLILSIGGVAD